MLVSLQTNVTYLRTRNALILTLLQQALMRPRCCKSAKAGVGLLRVMLGCVALNIPAALQLVQCFLKSKASIASHHLELPAHRLLSRYKRQSRGLRKGLRQGLRNKRHMLTCRCAKNRTRTYESINLLRPAE